MKIPKDTLAEASVIGCVILDNETWPVVATLEPRMFLEPSCRMAFAELTEIFQSDPQAKLDTVTLSGKLSGRVPASVVSRMADAPATTTMASEYAKSVRLKWLEREALKFSAEVVENEEMNLLDHIGKAEAHLEELKAGLEIHDGDIEQYTIRKIMSPLMEELNTPFATGHLVPFCLPTINEALGGGFVPGSLCFLAGAAKDGKTTLGCQFFRGVGELNIPAAYFSFEQNDNELLRTLLGQEAKVPGFVLRNRNLSAEDWQRIVPAAGSLSGMPLLLFGGRNTDPIRFWSQLEKCASKGYRVIVIDHLQLLSEVGDKDQGYAFILKRLTRRLKLLALKHSLVLFVLSQLQEKTEGGRPATWGGSSPSQDADALLVYRRPSRINPRCTDNDSIFLYLNRLPGGRRPEVDVEWNAQSNTIREIQPMPPVDDGRRYGEN